jgi:thiol-disulfide isomerase/thioredoxin
MKRILFFTQTSCAPCRVIKPIVEQMCRDTGTELQFIDITTPSGKESALNTRVVFTPTLIVLDSDFKELARLGTKDEVEQKLPALLKNTEGSSSHWLVCGLVALIGGFFVFKNK